MFDNLRDDSSFYEEEPSDTFDVPEAKAKPVPVKKRRRQGSRFMGMTAQQRFFLAFMLMITVCVLGMLAMLVTGKMGLF